MTTTILQLDKPNKNGRTYSKNCIMGALKKMNCKQAQFLIQSKSFDPVVDLEKVIGVVDKVFIIDDEVRVEYKFLGDDHHKYDAMMKSEQFFLRPTGIGEVDENGNVSNYKFSYLTITADPA